MKLYYPALAEFDRQFKEHILSIEHVASHKIHWKKFSYPNGDAPDEPEAVTGYVLMKGSKDSGAKKYLLPYMHGSVVDELPIIVDDTRMVSYKSEVYELVESYRTVKIRSEKKMSFRELVNVLCEHEHTNPKHQKLMTMIALSQLFDRANIRVASNPGFGKDSSVETLSMLHGDCLAIGKPTFAKLEHRTGVSWLVINEMMNLKKKDWEDIEQFLLNAGDFKPTYEKHSRSYKGSGESFDISKLSLSMFYNDITAYPSGDYFDTIGHKAVIDRFPAIRVYGRFTEPWHKIAQINVSEYVSENKEVYTDLLHTLKYFSEHMEDEINHYDRSLLSSVAPDITGRWLQCTHVFLKAFDMYSQTQDEFNAWILIYLEAIEDYKEMLEYPYLLKAANNRDPESSNNFLKGETPDTFIEKNKVLRRIIAGEDYTNDEGLEKFW